MLTALSWRLAMLGALLPIGAAAAEIEAASSITRVTVHPDGASIQRTVALDVPAGEQVIVLRGMPAGLDARSVRVSGEGSAALSIVSVDTRSIPGDIKPVIDADGERRLEALRNARDETASAIEAAEGQKAAIARYAEASPEKLGPETKPLDVERWPDAWRTIGQGFADINERLRTLKQKARDLADQIAALERARPQPQRPGAPKTDILVAVAGDGSAKATFTVSYQAPSAGWTPVYDAKLVTTGDKPKLEIVRRASVQQRTGEDWAGVALSLSTIRMRRGTAAPDLSTQTLVLVDPFAEAEAARQRMAPAAKTADSRSEALASNRAAMAPSPVPTIAAAPVAATPVLAAVDAGAYEATFSVPAPVSLPQDGTVRTFALTTRTTEPVLGARATPALEAAAFLEASFTNDDDVPLLPGEVSLQRDGTYIGKGRLTLVAPGEKLRLGFGADDRIKITRVPVARKDNDNGWGPNRSEAQDFRTTVKNGHAFPLRILVVDRMPVSENTAITVTPLDTNTLPTDKIVDDKRGVMGWAYDYKPGEQKDVRLGWRLRWPADRELQRQ